MPQTRGGRTLHPGDRARGRGAVLRGGAGRRPPLARRHAQGLPRLAHKANGYQSLHMLVTTRDGVEIEVQIRTGAMHEAAERGAAAHALYKAAATGGASERVESVVFA
eukprot:4738178-Prymnesium_polylepis.1